MIPAVETNETNLPIYQGPQTCNCTKLLMKANIVMNDHYGINSDFVPQIARPKWLNFYYRIWHQIQTFYIFVEIYLV